MAKPRMDLSAFVGKLLEEQDGDALRQGAEIDIPDGLTDAYTADLAPANEW